MNFLEFRQYEESNFNEQKKKEKTVKKFKKITKTAFFLFVI